MVKNESTYVILIFEIYPIENRHVSKPAAMFQALESRDYLLVITFSFLTFLSVDSKLQLKWDKAMRSSFT